MPLQHERSVLMVPRMPKSGGSTLVQQSGSLDRDRQALALPVEVLLLLPEAYLRSLSPEVEAEIRRRLRLNGR